PARRRSTLVAVGSVALVTIGLSGCSDDADYDYAGVCVDQKTNTRVGDERCDSSHPTGYHGGYGWYYVPRGAAAPRVGAVATGGTTSPSSSSWTGRGFSAEGGTVTRGGFSSAHATLGG
ncbi:MAG: hypothetical protein JWP82_3144, partial [Humibacillus sp.]|nr:hypothetical protein [Humibacillus sp.]